MSLRRRLERLEERTPEAGGSEALRALERYLHALENARREQAGLEILPDFPYTEEDYTDDMRTIAAYRDSLGWQTEEASALLDQWERDAKERMEKNHA